MDNSVLPEDLMLKLKMENIKIAWNYNRKFHQLEL